MAIYSTFFLARPQELLAGFPGWKPPLAEPVVRRVKNPFTGEAMSVTSCAPDWSDLESEDPQLPEIRVVVGSGDYGAYLEGRIPDFVRQSPHWCSKNLTNIEIEPLIAIVTANEETSLESAIYAPPSSGSGVEAIPEDFLVALAILDDVSLRRIAEAWAAELSTPDFTHSVSGERINDDCAAEDVLPVVNSLVSLARRRTDGQSIYLLIEA